MKVDPFNIDRFTIYPDRGEIQDGTDVRRIEPKIMEVLALLAAHAGEVVSRDTLIEEVWRGALISDDVISRCIYQLRKELGDEGRQLIRTVPKRGYRLDTVVGVLGDAGQVERPEPRKTESVRSRRAAASVAVALAVAVVVFVSQQDAIRPNLNRDDGIPITLAVRPFVENAVSNPGVLGPGVAEDMLHRLGQYSGLTVLARATSFEAGDRLTGASGADDLVMLEGAISERDGVWSLTARLIDADTGGELWREQFKTDTLPMSDIQQRIEISVVQALNAMPGGGSAPGKGYASDNLDAYRAFLAGRERLRLRTPEDLEAASRMFAESIRSDPDYAVAYASLAEANAHMTIYGGRNWNELRDTAKQSIRKALDINPDLAHVQAVDGLVYYVDNDLRLAAPALQKAIQLNPSYAAAYMWLGLVYQAEGNVERALEMHSMTATLSPTWATAQMNVGMSHQAMGNIEEAMRRYEQAVVLEPQLGNAWWAMGFAEWRRGNLETALRHFEQAEASVVVNADFYAQFALVCFDAGCGEDGRKHTAMATGLDPSSRWSIRAQSAESIIDNDLDGLVSYLEMLKVSRTPASDNELELANVLVLAGRWQEASGILERRYMGADPAFFDHWDVDWGFLHAMQLVLVREHLGQDWADLLAEVKAYLEQIDESQLSSAGSTYLRASVAAFEDRQEDALELLALAYEKGWRRWWWVEVDPFWDDYRGLEEYSSLVRKLKSTTAAQIEPAAAANAAVR